jgi:hypothetical protein
MLVFDIPKIIHSVWNKEDMRDYREETIILQIVNRAMKLTLVIIVGYHCHKINKKILFNIILSNLSPLVRIHDITGDHQCRFLSQTHPFFILKSSVCYQSDATPYNRLAVNRKSDHIQPDSRYPPGISS